ncbi:MAG TPA: His/Gly/Thr/Pro-type tRNA ligase C-terminal domain-containing protein [Planctomycetota bacterium]|nr:His/Gly/Thr/Pro-type tRNA ligase C-terminal domain-containing protein [Planctomycetota bacterium]
MPQNVHPAAEIDHEYSRLLRALALAAGAIARLWPGARLGSGEILRTPFPGFRQDLDLGRPLSTADLLALGVEVERLAAAEPPSSHRPHVHILVPEEAAPGIPRSVQDLESVLGIAWPSREALRRDVARHDGAAERSPARIGKRLKLFEDQGNAAWLPRGRMLRGLLEEAVRGLLRAACGAEGGSRAAKRSAEDLAGSIVIDPEEVEEQARALLGLISMVHTALGFRSRARIELPPRSPRGDGGRSSPLARALEASGIETEPDGDAGTETRPRIRFLVENLFGVFVPSGAEVSIDLEGAGPGSPAGEPALPAATGTRPLLLRFSILGAVEDAIALLLERTAGALPAWLAPVQARVLTGSEKCAAYGRAVEAEIRAAGIRADLDAGAEKLRFKARQAELEQIPFLVAAGTREMEARQVSMRSRERPEREDVLSVSECVARISLAARP